MSEETKKFTLAEYVFRDIRKAPEFQSVLENHGGIIDPINMIDVYRDMGKSCDAEKWGYALESYKYYPCFKNRDEYNYSFEDPKNMYFSSAYINVRISADTLTGPNDIKTIGKELIEKETDGQLRKILESILGTFCSVAYTIGNFCPLMHNIGSQFGTDTCWYKLNNYIKPDEVNDSIKTVSQYIKEPEKYNNLKTRFLFSYNPKRKKHNPEPAYYFPMFGLFPEELTGKEIIDRLFLMDYYTPDYKELVIKKKPQEYATSATEYIEFLDSVISLITKRGMRLYNALPDEMKAEKHSCIKLYT